jgi:hypothetical protein
MIKSIFGMLPIFLLCTCVSANASSAQSDKPALAPLQSYLEEHDITEDPLAAQYVALRCAAFYKAGAAEMASETDPEIAPLRKNALARASGLMKAAIAIDLGRTGRSEKQSSASMTAAETAMTRIYAGRMKIDKKNDGDISRDPLINGDSEICRALPGNPQ